MIDVKKDVYSKLSSLGLPCFYEVFLTKDTKLPCISYFEIANLSDSVGDTMGYSTIRMSTKIWAKDVKTLVEYSGKVDAAMRELGYKRVNSNELWLDGIGQLQLTYQAQALEEFNK